MRTLVLTLTLLMLAIPVGVGPRAEARARVVVVKTILIAPFERAEAAIVRSLQRDMDVYVVPVVSDNPGESWRIASLEPDVVVTIGSQATQWAVEAIPKSLPIVFAMVLDPVSSGLVRSGRRPGGRITGAALDIPLDTQFRALREVLGASRAGVLFSPATSLGTIDAARSVARSSGVELVAIPVANGEGFDQALEKVDSSLDAIWSVPDRLVMSRPFSQRILLHSIRRRIPLMGFSEQHVQAGALFSLVTSHEENGRQAADRVRRVIQGEPPGSIPIGFPQQLEIVFNPRTAESLGVRVRQNSVARVRPAR